MKVLLYKFINDNEHLNALGEQGWGLTIDNEALLAKGAPILVSKEFKMDAESDTYKFALEWLHKVANGDAKNRKALSKMGFEFSKVYVEGSGKKEYRLEKQCFERFDTWRIEINHSDLDDFPYLYITFGSPFLRSPSFYNREIIDEYVPKEIIEKALASGSIVPDEYEEPEGDAQETEEGDD